MVISLAWALLLGRIYHATMRMTLRWVLRGVVVVCLALSVGVVVLRVRTREGSGNLDFGYLTGPEKRLVRGWSVISAPSADLLVNYYWGSLPAGRPAPELRNSMIVEHH